MIEFIANRDTNYVFHMLSVARCGYDNDYGSKYRITFPDASALAKYENELSVCGGSHCGALYDLLVCKPAAGEVCAEDYFLNLLRQVNHGKLSGHLLRYEEDICRICTLMARYYKDFVRDVWAVEEQRILTHIFSVERQFRDSSFVDKANTLLDIDVPFVASFVSSVENGAEGIDVSDVVDVFGIERSAEDALFFIGHEYLIYQLKHIFKETPAFHSFATWRLTEALAEYYIQKILGETRFFAELSDVLAFYEASHYQTPLELFASALVHFNGQSGGMS